MSPEYPELLLFQAGDNIRVEVSCRTSGYTPKLMLNWH
jgi:hypothetical protein